MKGKLTIIIAVVEALSLLAMRFADWKEAKNEKPAAAKAQRVKGRRVVNLAPQEYDEGSPEGENHAINFLAGGDAADQKLHEEAERPDRKQ